MKKIPSKIDIVSDIVNKQDNIIFVTDGSKIIYANKQFVDFFDIKDDDIIYNIKDIFLENRCCFCDKIDDKFIKIAKDIKEGNEAVSLVNVKTGNTKGFHIEIDRLKDSDEYYVITFVDIHLKLKNYYYYGTHDGLTKLYNKAIFMDTYSNELERAKRYDYVFSIIMADIDDFKKVNDAYGHIVGDHVLATIAQAIKDSVRKTDICARFGGEEFIILLPKTNSKNTLNVVSQIQKSIKNATFDNVITKKPTLSFGISQFNEADNHHSVIDEADKALYKAKANGKNCAITF